MQFTKGMHNDDGIVIEDSWMRSMDESGISRVLGTKNPFVHFGGRE